MSREREKIQHESYGMIGFSKVSCSGKQKFFGSDLPVHNFIEMSVIHAEIERDLSKDWYHGDHGKPEILKIRMTPNQFSEMITSMNQGSGIPCTIETINGKSIAQEAENENRKQFTHRQFKERMEEFAKSLQDAKARIKALSDKKTLSLADQKELTGLTDWVIQETTSNVPYFMQCFQDTMDKVVNEAKSEVDSAIQHKIIAYGLQAIAGQTDNKIFEIGPERQSTNDGTAVTFHDNRDIL